MQLAVVIPTYNERENVQPLVRALHKVLTGISYEIIFVDDDSPDGTASLIRLVSRRFPSIRVLQRIGRRGLASACIEGILCSAADYVVVMDADMQHDERVLPAMLELIEYECLDLVVASRHIEGGGIEGGMNRRRRLLSDTGKRLSKLAHEGRLSDPMSGFFVIRRSYFEQIAHSLSGIGFKILLDIYLSGRHNVRIGEVPYEFRERHRGSSKLDILVGLEYLELLLDKYIGRLVSVRFLMFCLVGGLGAVLHLLIMGMLQRWAHATFLHEQLIATSIIMALNYSLNNAVSYRDRRRRGLRYWTGLLTFYAACSLGMLANVSLANDAYRHGLAWPLAAVIGIIFGAVWNYGVTSVTTWRAVRTGMQTTAMRQRLIQLPSLEEQETENSSQAA